MHLLGSFIYASTVDTSGGLESRRSRMDNDKEQPWSSEHHHNFIMLMSAEERRMTNIDSRETSICMLKTLMEEESKTKKAR